MKKHYYLFFSACFFFLSLAKAQYNVKVQVTEVAVLSAQDCDAGASDNSDFLFEYAVSDNSPFAYGNNSPVSGSIGACNYVYETENNGPFALTPAAPGTATFNPSNGVFFDRIYTCRHDMPSQLTFTWTAYENDDVTAPSMTPIANGQIPAQVNTFTLPVMTGTYSAQYTATSADGSCPQTYRITFGVNLGNGSFTPLTIADIDGSTVCTGNTNGQAGPTLIGGSGTILYDWSNDGTGDFDDSPNIYGLSTGTYTLVVKDGLNCTDTGVAVVISQDPPMPVNFTSSSNPLCTGQSYPFAVSTQTGTANYVWAYNTGGMVIAFSANAATLTPQASASSGTLSVYAQNTCSVSNTATMAVTVITSPSVSITGDNNVCDNAQGTITASGASTYTWSTGATTPGITVSPGVTTVYTVSATQNGCPGNASYTMNVIPSPTFQVSGPSASVCPGTAVTATASGNGVNYIWSDGFVGASHTFSNSATTVYTVTGTYTNTCFSQQTYTFHVYANPSLSISGNHLSCLHSQQSYTASGADTYTWSTTSTAPVITLTTTGQSTLTVAGTNTATGCSSSSASFTVSAYPQPSLTITGNTYVCGGQSTVLSVSGADFYLWSTGATASTETIVASGTTTVTVKGTNINGGCKDSTSTVVHIIPQPTVSISGVDSICRGQSATLTASGASTYSWSTGVGTASVTVSPTATTIYTVSSTGSTCNDTKTHQVYVKPLPLIDFTGTRVCDTDPAFTLNGTPIGGTYTGQGVNGAMFNPQAAGDGTFTIVYSVTQQGCTATSQANIQVLTCTGVEELNKETTLDVFPNPNNGLIHIVSSAGIREVRVSDATGRLVAIVETNAASETIDISNEPAGIYLLAIRLENGAYSHYKVMKQ